MMEVGIATLDSIKSLHDQLHRVVYDHEEMIPLVVTLLSWRRSTSRHLPVVLATAALTYLSPDEVKLADKMSMTSDEAHAKMLHLVELVAAAEMRLLGLSKKGSEVLRVHRKERERERRERERERERAFFGVFLAY
jgi:hypothetical protein